MKTEYYVTLSPSSSHLCVPHQRPKMMRAIARGSESGRVLGGDVVVGQTHLVNRCNEFISLKSSHQTSFLTSPPRETIQSKK